ncbi:SDR family NAD(P)-dependent oxidoreductase [Mycobacterium tilburgii]|uniref:SDR family NAD(P)-dependent oxidoreductase n=1 Tax=Mycobacterium tilburgii TaxID=44467 RepID=UPI001642EA21|nr:SDR family NAD(P)-dependent oxidoreductase [Mycobacterium tilburgii]
MSEKVGFVTGTSRGFGREWTVVALERGDKVAATARDTATLDDLATKYGDALLPIQLDVTDRDADFAAVKHAYDHFGRLDVVVNNAGYGHFGFVEELSEQEARDPTRSRPMCSVRCGSLRPHPYLREQGSGHIIRVSSIGGFSQALARGSGGVWCARHADRTGRLRHRLSGSSAKHSDPLPVYDELRAMVEDQCRQRWSAKGHAQASAAAILKVVTPSSRRCGCSSAARRCRTRKPTTRTGSNSVLAQSI